MNDKKTMNDVLTIMATTGSSLIMASALNDIYCFNFLKQRQYKYGKNSFFYYKAKYSNLFFILSGLSGFGIGTLYSYYQKPLINLLLSN